MLKVKTVFTLKKGAVVERLCVVHNVFFLYLDIGT